MADYCQFQLVIVHFAVMLLITRTSDGYKNKFINFSICASSDFIAGYIGERLKMLLVWCTFSITKFCNIATSLLSA